MSFPNNLKTVYNEGRLLPFIGAGISMSIEWNVGAETRRGPSWSELVNKAADLLGFTDPDLLRVRGTDLQILEYFKQENGNSTALTNWLVREFQPTNDALKNSSIHKGFMRISKMQDFLYHKF